MGTIKKLGIVLLLTASFLAGFMLANEELSLMDLQMSMTHALRDGLDMNVAKSYVQELLESEQVHGAIIAFREFVENILQ